MKSEYTDEERIRLLQLALELFRSTALAFESCLPFPDRRFGCLRLGRWPASAST
jgi:hypothetical protein